MTGGRRSQLSVGLGPQFDTAAGEAHAVVTLLATGEPGDVQMASRVLNEMMATPGGEWRAARGLSSVCAGLLALLEFYGRVPPERGLRELGRLIAEASNLG
jgi:hypothetical protein